MLLTLPNRSQTFRFLVAFGGIAAASLIGGCNSGHGEYTKGQISVAQEKMALLKSGTEWGTAQQQYYAGELDKALKSVDRSLALNPNVPKSHVLRGRILLEKGRVDEAQKSLLRAEELDPNSVDAQYFLALIAERMRQPDEALKRYCKAMELDQDDPQYVIAASEMLTQAGKLDEAEKMLNDHKKNFEYNAGIRQAMGHIATLRGDSKTAVIYLNDAAMLAPTDQRIAEDLVCAELAAGHWADAELHLTTLLEKDANKNRRDLRQMRARCLVAMDRPVEARSIYIDLTGEKEGGRDIRSWVELGHVSMILKDKVHLRLAAARVVALDPEKPEGYVLKGMYARLDNQPEQALKFFDEAIARASGTPDVSPLILKALVLQDLNRVNEARAALAQANQIDPNNPQVRDLGTALQATAGVDTEGPTN